MTFNHEQWQLAYNHRLDVLEMNYRAFEPVVDFFSKIDPGANVHDRYEVDRFSDYYWGRTGTTTFARMRFDWEIRNVVLPEISDRGLVQLMMDDFANEFTSVVINGDTSQTSDPLLKVIDGEKKRDKQVASIEVTSGQLGREVKAKRGKVEFTFYTVIAVDWKDND